MQQEAWPLAQSALAKQDWPVAEQALQRVLAERADFTFGRILLAGVFLAGERVDEARTQLLTAAESPPDDAAMLCRLCQSLLRVGEVLVIRRLLRSPVVSATTNGPALAGLSHVQQALGEHEEALATMERAKAAGFDNADFRFFRGVQLQFNGQLAEAGAELQRCLDTEPTHGRAALALSRMQRATHASNRVDAIRAGLRRVQPGSEDHASFEFALYKEHEDLGEIDAAWSALERANAVMHRRSPHDAAAERALFDALIQRCDTALLGARGHVDADDDLQPIFVLGMPRSGTTVLDRILGNHAAIANAGELADFSHQLKRGAGVASRGLLDARLLARLGDVDFAAVGKRYLEQTRWRAHSRQRYVDKFPANFMFAGLIATALPGARILHLVRDPMDVCFSNWRAMFGSAYAYSYALPALAQHHLQYRRLMRHWHAMMPGRILDVAYERLVAHPEAVAAAVFDFCGVVRQSGCADLGRNTRPSATLSSVQIREPLHSRGIAEWRRYGNRLDGLRRALDDAGEG